MRLSTLGDSAEMLELARAIARHGRLRLTECFGCGGREPEFRKFAVDVRRDASWESLLASTCDGMVVEDDGSAERAEQLRRLAQAGSPLLVLCPVRDGLLAVELDMIAQETGCLLWPCHLGTHPAIGQMANMIRQGDASPVGVAQQLVFQRAMDHRDRSSVLRQLAADVSSIRGVLGDVRQVGAMGTLAQRSDGTILTVNMSGPGSCIARWSVGPRVDPNDGSIKLDGTLGSATLTMAGPAPRWPYEIRRPGDGGRSTTFPDWDPHDDAVTRFADAIDAGGGSGEGWLNACRDLDVAETVPDSLRRGRTIELHQPQQTESGNFKGVMAIGGCGLLLLTFLLLLVVFLVEGVRLPFRHHFVWLGWPLVLAGLLTVFLAVQFLHVLVPDRDSREEP